MVDRKLVEAPTHPPSNFISSRSKAALLYSLFFGEFRCGVPLFIVILVIYKYNQSAEGTGGLGTIRGNKVGDSNVEFANLHCNNNDKKNIKKKKK